MDLHTVIKFLEYIIFSSHKKGHGIHSPFVFHLVSKVFRNKIPSGVVLELENIRKQMISEKMVINVSDFGAGSVYTSKSLRRVSDIAVHSSIPGKYGSLLYNLSKEFGGRDILELGTSLGISTMYLAAGSSSSTVHTIEGSPELSGLAKDNFSKCGFSNIISYTGTFDDVIDELDSRKFSPGLVFIDGDHRKEPVIRYFEKMVHMGTGNTVVALDDIHGSASMGEAWEVIKKHPKVSLSVDIFRMGLVFFRQGLSRADYIIRY